MPDERGHDLDCVVTNTRIAGLEKIVEVGQPAIDVQNVRAPYIAHLGEHFEPAQLAFRPSEAEGFE
ncbi:MAG: hypothetical protein DRP79_06035 [Planctomycetota bacterium]|nr:MAG: hypothetical protein DRP79_06035 [Planctomycetota bacterium]